MTVPMHASSNSVKNKQNLEKFCLFFIFLFYFISLRSKPNIYHCAAQQLRDKT